ncbi:protein phosphatase 2C domain-containing protein [Catelliglobosispora koreensis]|uniref:protein phosphatase 2C domain-containing protein n=1 Tax=Catelliglobosispora koreensis TaxID=129052 RepID=UPI000376AD2C|nr:protein phosphatase 2C domain-containing protein [Catelliglobosispora koreensis]
MFETYAVTEAAPGRPNEDFYLASGEWLIVMDGVAPTPGQANGCTHGVRWFVNHLGAELAASLSNASDSAPLEQLLAEAIGHTATLHGPECDLSTPLTPAATVGIVRQTSTSLDWLVLGDVTVAWLSKDDSPGSVTDDRLEHLPNAPIVISDVRRYDPEFVMKVRNRPGGFWVAASESDAANEALTGSFALADIVTIGVFTDGLSRLAERYGRSWLDIFALAASKGMHSLVADVRAAEIADPDPTRWRGKTHDDATGIIWRRIS